MTSVEKAVKAYVKANRQLHRWVGESGIDMQGLIEATFQNVEYDGASVHEVVAWVREYTKCFQLEKARKHLAKTLKSCGVVA